MRFVGALILWIIIFIVAGAIYVWSGIYNIGADVPHWPITHQVISALREHSIDRRAAEIQPPKLDDPAMVAKGAEHYAEMCTGCHLAPGMTDSEIRHGLYPKPPNLTRFAPEPAAAFWVIKHGIKMTGMPAWGPTHSDEMIWAIVAYLQKQPRMTVAEYQTLTANAAEQHAHDMHDVVVPVPAGSALPAPAASAGL